MRELDRRCCADGVTVLEDVEFPPSFEPQRTELAFAREGDLCEVYIDEEVDYLGRDDRWRDIVERPVVSGGARPLLSVEGGVGDAIAVVESWLERARRVDGGANHAEEPTVDVGEVAEGALVEPEADELRNLVAVHAREGAFAGYTGRRGELRRLKTNLLRESKPGALLYGPPGVGKTTLVEMLAAEVAEGRVPEGLLDTPIFELPLGRLLENARGLGDVERAARRLLDRPEEPIFFLDEIHQLGRREFGALADQLKPPVERGDVRVIGATTPTDWRQLDDPAFERRLTQIRVGEPSLDETLEMAEAKAEDLEEHHGLSIPERRMREAIVASDRYVCDGHFPDKAVDVLDHASAMQLADDSSDSREEQGMLERDSVLAAVAAQGGLPAELLDEDEVVSGVESTFEAVGDELIGQDDALETLRRTLVSQYRSRFVGWERAVDDLDSPDDRRPVASLFACGPTGVGKT
ncbi:MAG: AAA family ATPase, partial [Bradymonadaceae bacterium]